MKLLYPLNIKNNFIFNANSKSFIVKEIPLYEFSGSGEHLILYIRKKDMTTWDMVGSIARYLNIKHKEIGYAGLKDKNGMTMQYISLPLKGGNEKKIERFEHEKIKILDINRHKNKIRIGHLKGNHFKIILKKVLKVEKDKLNSTLKWVENNGIPNYFGVQRFGNGGENWKDGKGLVEKKSKIHNKKIKKFLIGAYQAYLFNLWLSKRIELSLLLKELRETEVEEIFGFIKGSLKDIKRQRQFFKLLNGDLMMHYPHGRIFQSDSPIEESERFIRGEISPTGLLSGKKVKKAIDLAGKIEMIFDKNIDENGSRRYAWVRVEEIKRRYLEEKAHYELSFYLPKGSYATNLLSVLGN